MDFWTVPPLWQGETAFIIAGGTSVAQQDVSALRGRRVIVINSSYEVAPWADFLFFGDKRWYLEHGNRPLLRSFEGKVVTVSGVSAASNHQIIRLKRIVPPPGLVTARNSAACLKTSMQGGMNFAVHLGVKRIVLLGADARRADDGRTHHHSSHKWNNKQGNKTWEIQMNQLQLIVDPLRALGIDVINTSPISRLPWWVKISLEEALCLP